MKKLIFTMITCHLLVAVSGCQKQESRGADPAGADNWQGARLAIIKTGVEPVSVSIAKNDVVQAQSSDQLTIQVSQDEKENESFRKSIVEFQSEITCVEQDGKAISAPQYSRTITAKQFSAIEIWGLLPSTNQLEARTSLKCNLATKITNVNGSTIAWPSLVFEIKLNSAQQLMTLNDINKNMFVLDQPLTLTQLSTLEFKAANNEDLLMNLKCSHYSASFRMSELKNEKHILNTEGSLPRFEDTRVRSPLQDCIFIFENTETGRFLVSPRYLIDFEFRPRVTETFQIATTAMPSQKPHTLQPYFSLSIENLEDFPVLVGHGIGREDMKMTADYYYVSKPGPYDPPTGPDGKPFAPRGFIVNAATGFLWNSVSLPVVRDAGGEHYTVIPPKGILHLQAGAEIGYADMRSCVFQTTYVALVGVSVKNDSRIPVSIMSYITAPDLSPKIIRLQPLVASGSLELQKSHFFSEGPNQIPGLPEWTRRTDLSCR